MFLYIGKGELIDARKVVMIVNVQKAKGGQFSSLKEKARAAILFEDVSFYSSEISVRALSRRIERLGGR